MAGLNQSNYHAVLSALHGFDHDLDALTKQETDFAVDRHSDWSDAKKAYCKLPVAAFTAAMRATVLLNRGVYDWLLGNTMADTIDDYCRVRHWNDSKADDLKRKIYGGNLGHGYGQPDDDGHLFSFPESERGWRFASLSKAKQEAVGKARAEASRDHSLVKALLAAETIGVDSRQITSGIPENEWRV